MANAKSKTFSNFFRVSTILASIVAIIFLFMIGRYLLSLPFFALIFGAFKKRLFNIFNIFYFFRLLSRNKVNSNYSSNRGSPNSVMGKEEACKVLGLSSNYTKEDIVKAHKNLIKNMQPDKNGNNYLASKINEAREVLLREYRV